MNGGQKLFEFVHFTAAMHRLYPSIRYPCVVSIPDPRMICTPDAEYELPSADFLLSCCCRRAEEGGGSQPPRFKSRFVPNAT